ncbi:MAG TPA: TonB-dependent receptor [Sphingomicrobium sp.]
MRLASVVLGMMLAIGGTLPAAAQEVLVSGQRRGYNPGDATYNNGIVATSRPIIHLRRLADFAVQTVRVSGDTRERDSRRSELRSTIRNALAAADKAGIELATGDYVLERLTPVNFEGLPFNGDGRPDTDVTTFLAKVRLTPGMTIDAARERIAKFVASVSKTGRTQVGVLGDVGLSVVDPDQYRGAIVDLIAADAAISAGKFGADTGVDVTGLDRPVEWARAGPTDVFLFLPASYVIRKH